MLNLNPGWISTAMKGLAVVLLLEISSLAIRSAETAHYRDLPANEFLKRWLVLSPLRVFSGEAKAEDETTQEKVFAQDLLADSGGEAGARAQVGTSLKIGGKDYAWRLVESKSDIVNLAVPGGSNEFAVAYAFAEIEMSQGKTALLGLGSDDAVKVWLNGELVHERWALRAATKDQDVVRLNLLKGSNRLLLKVQNGQGEWGFICRLLGPEVLAERLCTAAAQGDLDAVKLVLAQGGDVNARYHSLSPLYAAQIAGDREMTQFLISQGANPLPVPIPEEVIDARLTELTRGESSGLAVLVARNGKILFAKGYGYANLENATPVTPETKFRIGSITKQFTAAAILRLQEQGRLSVSDKLSKFIPDYPRGDEVTLRHLLTHTSGIHSYTSKPDFMDTVTVPVTPENLIKSFKNDPYDFSPGEKWAYCNSGYYLLGFIVEKVSGATYADFLRQQFFKPLGMTNTGVHTPAAILKHEATGYSWQNGGLEKALNWDMSRAGGAGAIYSTVEDLFRWNEAIFQGKALNEASLKAAFTPVVTKQDADSKGPKEEGYGFGWMMGRTRGLRTIGHGGGLQGFVSYLVRYPDQHFTVVALANAATPAPGLDPSGLADQVARLYLWREMKPKETSIEVKPEVLDSIVGRYDYGGAILTVTREDNRLYAQLTGQPKFEIFPKSTDTFFWKVVEAEVQFVRSEKGEVTKAIHHQGGMTIQAARLANDKEIRLAPAILDSYVGKYDYGQGKSILTVTREGDHLFAQITGQPKFEIYAKAETEFFWKVVAAQVTFVKDSQGKVTKAIHHQGGATIDAPKVE